MMMYKLFKKLAIFLFLMVVMFTPIFYVVAEEIKSGIDVVLLIDRSGSMRSSDKTRIAIEASKMFIDMLETKISRVGVLAFNESTVGIKELKEISSHEDKESLKKILDEFEYDGHTDIGLSLQEAVAMLLDSNPNGNSPMILLLTDGKIEIEPENEQNRTVEKSLEDIETALLKVGKNIPIYTIGLDYEESVDAELLKNISESTAARNYIINEAETLPQIFNEIFADHIKSTLIEALNITSDGENYADVKIHIDSPFISEANVIMLSGKGIADTKLFDPNGKEVEFDQKKVSLSSSQRYSMIKILEPQSGEWILQVKGIENDSIKVNLIYQYNVDVDVSLQHKEEVNGKYNHENPITVVSHFLLNGEKIYDDNLYESSTAFLVLEDKERNVLEKIEMQYESGQYTAEYIPKNEESIVISVHTENENFSKESKRFDIEFIQPEPEIPTTEAVEEVESKDSIDILKTLTILTILLFTLLFIFIFIYFRQRNRMIFTGYLEIRAMGSDQFYMPLETPSLNTFVGKVGLGEFLATMLKLETVEKLGIWPNGLQLIELRPAIIHNQNAIVMTNKSECKILDENENVIDKKLFNWFNNQRITIVSSSDNDIKIEMTYRTEGI